MATIQYRNIYASGLVGVSQVTRDRADRAADMNPIDRVAVVVITTNGDELPTVEVIDVRKPKPPTTWAVIDGDGDRWSAADDETARNIVKSRGGHAWRYDGDGTVTEVLP